MVAILLSILLTTCTLANPAASAPVSSSQSIPWTALKANKSLERFQSTLLNQTLLPFLNECYTDLNSSTSKLDPRIEITCSQYLDAIIQLNSTNFIVDAPTLFEVLKQDYASEKFCQEKHSFPTVKQEYSNKKTIDINDAAACGVYCLDYDLKPRSICKFLAWFGELIKSYNSSTKTIVEITPAPAAVPVAPQSNDRPDLVNSSTKTVDLIDKNKKKLEADANVKNEVLAPSNIQPIAAAAPAVPAAPAAPAAPVAPVAPVAPAAPASSTVAADSRKLNSSVLQSPSANEQELPIENPQFKVAPVDIEKKEKSPQKPVDEEIKENESPKLNSNPQDDIPLSPNNVEKSATLSEDQQMYNNNDSEEDIGDDANGIKNNVAIEEPDEKEHDQKSSQEIDNSNFIQTTKKEDPFKEESGSNFFTYFLIGMFLCIALYVIYHNKSKILALLLEGRRGDKARSGRRKHTAAYRKLDSNLEEAITSSASGRTTQIIY